jgi:hypothetical protein
MYIVKSKYIEKDNKVHKEYNIVCETLSNAKQIRDKLYDEYIKQICPYINISLLHDTFNLYCIDNKDNYYDLMSEIKRNLIYNSIVITYNTIELKAKLNDLGNKNDILTSEKKDFIKQTIFYYLIPAS